MEAQFEPITRPKSDYLDSILGQAFPALDKGFVRVVNYMGDESSIVQAARVSYGTGTKQKREDAELINFLYRHAHSSPFEMCDIVLHVKLPIFVARQWIRHRTAAVNEYSARYSLVKEEFYIPDEGVVLGQSKTNKQGSEGELSKETKDYFLKSLMDGDEKAFEDYHSFTDLGVARETARMGLPLNSYTEWYWKINLHNLLHFLRLRKDKHAQYEIRVYADIIGEIVDKWLPNVWEAFRVYQLDSIKFSSKELRCLKALLTKVDLPEKPDPNSKFSLGEWREFVTKFNKIMEDTNG